MNAAMQVESDTTNPSVWQEEMRKHVSAHVESAMLVTTKPCKVCQGDSPLHGVVDFSKCCETPRYPSGHVGVPVYYRRCKRCGFVYTDFFDDFSPGMWTTYLYNEDYYATVDPDYLDRRPQMNAAVVDALLCAEPTSWIGLDYGGGNGLTAKHLQGRGYSYDTHDPFGVSDMHPSRKGRYNFCSSFEVAEHTPDPVGFMADIVALCSPDRLAVLVGTHTNDGHLSHPGDLNWWYAAPRNGHISLHSRRSLTELSKRFALDCYSLSEQTHLFTRGYTPAEARRLLMIGKVRGRIWRLLTAAPGSRA